MHERTMLLRLKRFDATQKAMKVAVLEKMIFDFDNTALAYVDPTKMAALITALAALQTWMEVPANGDLMFAVTPAQPAQI